QLSAQSSCEPGADFFVRHSGAPLAGDHGAARGILHWITNRAVDLGAVLQASRCSADVPDSVLDLPLSAQRQAPDFTGSRGRDRRGALARRTQILERAGLAL